VFTRMSLMPTTGANKKRFFGAGWRMKCSKAKRDSLTKPRARRSISLLHQCSPIMRGLSFVGSTISLTLATIFVVIRFAMRKWGREAKLFAVTMIGAGLLNMTLKLTFKRTRPEPFFNLTLPETYSFPSGHSLMSACFFGALAAILTARIKSKRVRVAIWIVAALMFLLIGLSRIYLGVHHTTDVIAGFAAALIWILVVRFVEMQFARRKLRKKGQD
jgi:undecaprenyl-diphosphatase